MFGGKYSLEIGSFSEKMRELKKRILKRHIPKQGADKTCAERIKPFLLLFKLCGFFANNITAGRVKRCFWPTYGICFFWICLFVSYTCFSIVNIINFKRYSFKLTVHIVKHFLGYMSLSADIITAYTSQNHFNKFFDRLDGYDHEAARLRKKRRDSLWVPRIVALLIMSVTLLIIYVIIYYYMVLKVLFFQFLSDSVTIILQMYSFLDKFLLLYLMLERFKHLNKDIVPNVSWDEKRREPNTIRISDVKIMHSILYDAHEAFNDIYKNPLLLSFAYLMTCIIANLSFFRQSVLLGSSLLVPPIMLMLIICIISHHTAEEANNILCVLNKSMTMLVHSGETMTKISTITYFLHNSVSFDAAGFFTIDLPLFQSIIATLATYFLLFV